MGARDEPWMAIAEEQAGVIGRSQLLQVGLTPRQSRRWLDSGHWRPAHPGVYFTFTGPVPDQARVWAAVLYAGEGAAAAGRTALWLAQAISELPDLVQVQVPHRRQVRSRAGVRVTRSRAMPGHLHPAARPPRVRLEVALLDVTDGLPAPGQVVDLVLRTIQRRLTTADRIAAQLVRRHRHHWRGLLGEVLAEVRDGVASTLELRYARGVERAHGLPAGRRNLAERHGGHTRYRDVRYDPWTLVVELDGREAHPPDETFRDLRRDNEAVLAGDHVLRYGWRDVVGRACLVAGQIGGLLNDQGWTGRPHPCGLRCELMG